MTVETVERSDDNFLNDLEEKGFIILNGPFGQDEMAQMRSDYVANVRLDSKKASIGRTTIRVNDVVGWNPLVERLYTFEPILRCCSQIINRPYKLSTLHARSVFSHVADQDLHVDCDADIEGFPLACFIYMIDDFTVNNGATCFVPGSHKWPARVVPAEKNRRVTAIGNAGSIIIFNGSVWHGHSANKTGQQRRSIQGAFIRHSMQAAMNFPAKTYKN